MPCHECHAVGNGFSRLLHWELPIAGHTCGRYQGRVAESSEALCTVFHPSSACSSLISTSCILCSDKMSGNYSLGMDIHGQCQDTKDRSTVLMLHLTRNIVKFNLLYNFRNVYVRPYRQVGKTKSTQHRHSHQCYLRHPDNDHVV